MLCSLLLHARIPGAYAKQSRFDVGRTIVANRRIQPEKISISGLAAFRNRAGFTESWERIAYGLALANP